MKRICGGNGSAEMMDAKDEGERKVREG